MKYEDSYDKKYFERRQLTRNERVYTDDLEFILRNINSVKNVLDYGCGEMFFTKYLEKITSNVYVYDVSPEIKQLDIYKNYFKEDDKVKKYEMIVLRGVLQHLPHPFFTLERLIKNRLKKNGYLVFLATPNINSPYYFLNKTLPPLVSKLNYWNPSDIELKRVVENYGLSHIKTYYPYLKSGYAKPLRDHLNFIRNLFGVKTNYPFWLSMMNMIFKNQ